MTQLELVQVIGLLASAFKEEADQRSSSFHIFSSQAKILRDIAIVADCVAHASISVMEWHEKDLT